MVKVVKNNGQYRLTVPIDIVRDKGWDAGTQIRFVETENGDIILRVIKPREETKRPEKTKEAGSE